MSYHPLPKSLTIKKSEVQGLGLFSKTRILKDTNLGLTHVIINGTITLDPIDNASSYLSIRGATFTVGSNKTLSGTGYIRLFDDAGIIIVKLYCKHCNDDGRNKRRI